MPHNISKFNNDFYLLDSLRGNLLGNNMSIQGTFNAFTRGLDYHENLFYIGQSKNRNFQKPWVYQIITQLIVELLYLTTKKISRFSVSP